LLGFGLIMYALGRSQDIILFEVGSQIPVILGTLLITRGLSVARSLWFAIFFLVFMIPLPGFIVDAATGPLKQYISIIAEQALYSVGYPIARSGVTLTIGPYQLLVADACSGLHSMFSLSAMGLLYLYLMQHTSVTRNALIMAAILPIAFAANVVRVIVLVLITYHLGDEAGQGFLHGFAGIMLFIIALLFLFALDGLLGYVFPDRRRA
jgi:exosortase B